MTLTHLISVLLHQGISVLLDDKNLLLVNCLSYASDLHMLLVT
jgi:hypothetical protein